jgi:hypothetical protein
MAFWYLIPMQAALFDLRCFDAGKSEFPVYVASFIVYGAPAAIALRGNELFEEHISQCKKPCQRTHKVGPLSVHPFIKTDSSERKIDWAELSRIVEEEIPERPDDEGSCIFSGPSEAQEDQSLNLRDLPPEIANQLAKEMGEAMKKHMLSSAPKRSRDRHFHFIGSRFQSDIFERVGEVFIIEAGSLAEATGVCWGVAGGSLKAGIHVEWCCPIHEAE